VLVFDQDTPLEILRQLRPEVLVKGGTYTTDQVVGHEIVASYGGEVCVTGMVEGISTTKLVNSLAQQKSPTAELVPASIPSPHFQSKPSNVRIAS
jgi:D-beta-D-heptose 7-phosphate kinase/D-beta-D-heptose 1-phosphate adenosyltransferase